MIRPCRGILPRIPPPAFIDRFRVAPGSPVAGSPGSVPRSPTAEDVASIAGCAERYVGYARDYR